MAGLRSRQVEKVMKDIITKIEEMASWLPEVSYGQRTEAREGSFVVRFNADRASALALADKLKKGSKKRVFGTPRKRTPAPGPYQCVGGPFHGADIYLQTDQPQTVVFTTAEHTGRYVGDARSTRDKRVFWEES